MKETIYTIPINNAFDEDCSCALCGIYKKLNEENVESALGAGMMEPDLRIISNEKGFCKAHYGVLVKESKALPLSLVLQTHSAHQNNEIFKILSNNGGSKSFFGKKNNLKENAKKAAFYIKTSEKSCSICEKTAAQMERYIKNIIFLWKKEPEFKAKFNSKDGFCLPHFGMLLDVAANDLNDKDFDDFYNTIVQMQKKSLSEMYEDISEFTKLFDYKNKKTPTEKIKSAIKRTIHKYSGLIFDETY